MTQWKLLGCAFLAAAVSASEQKPDAAEQSRALAAMRDYALNYTKNLPNFICTQVIEREFGPEEHRGHDAIEEQVTYVDGKESYTVTKLDGHPVAKGDDPGHAHMLSSGEFGTLLANTLNPEAGGNFRWTRATTRNGRKVNVFSYRVPQKKGYGLVESKRTLVVPYKGLVYADAETGAVVRIELDCEIPASSEFRELGIALDYKPADVGGHEYLLPSHYRLRTVREEVRANGRLPQEERRLIQETNETDYKGYRRFDADSSITFGGDTGPGR